LTEVPIAQYGGEFPPGYRYNSRQKLKEVPAMLNNHI